MGNGNEPVDSIKIAEQNKNSKQVARENEESNSMTVFVKTPLT